MRLEDRFGDYLLFHRLGSSPLGTTYRAGRLQARAVDRVVLLQRFDGDEVDQPRLVAAAARRRPLLDRLTAPRFASGLGLGAEDGVPYVAYDYLLGRTLRQTLDRASSRGEAPATAYLVALVEQAAAGLVAAARLRLDEGPIRHGFLIPELLLLSAEGRIYPLAFTHGPALLEQEPLRRRFASYLAPETLGADDPLADDVYSLAAILFEGLTGAPPEPDEATASQVDRALLTTAGAPLAPPLQDLLKAGLATKAERPALERFHRSLRRMVDENEDSPSQFQLAFFLHRLFRDEMEAEAVEMREEKTTHFDPVALAPPMDTGDQAPAAADPAPPPGASAPPSVATPAPQRAALRPFWAGMALALALAAGSAALVRSSRPAPARPTAGDETAPAAIDSELRRLVSTGASELQRRLEEEHEPRLTRLRHELLAARAARRKPPAVASEAAPARPESPPPVAAPAAAAAERAGGAPASGSSPAAETPASEGLQAPPTAASDAAGRRAGEAVAAATRTGDDATPVLVANPAPEPASRQSSTAGGPAAPARQTAERTAPPPLAGATTDSATARPATGPQGDPEVVEAPAGEAAPEDAFVPPRLLTPPQPRYPAAAQRLRKSARVQVRVRVDAEGRVGETELVSGPSGFGFAKSAVEAAARTRWEPARRGGEATSAWAVLTIDFRL